VISHRAAGGYLRWVIAGLTACMAFGAAATEVDGYLGARFGMTAEQVAGVLEHDGIVQTGTETFDDGDHLIRAERDRGWVETDLLYVFPGGRDRLALVIEFFPGGTNVEAVEADITERHGEPLSTEMAGLARTHMADSLPPGVEDLTLWVTPDRGPGRFIRMMAFTDHIAVEYLSSALMAGSEAEH
jgi:hypothetical protein